MSKMNSFIDYASDILGDTNTGISTTEIIIDLQLNIMLIFLTLKFIKDLIRLLQIKELH